MSGAAGQRGRREVEELTIGDDTIQIQKFRVDSEYGSHFGMTYEPGDGQARALALSTAEKPVPLHQYSVIYEMMHLATVHGSQVLLDLLPWFKYLETLTVVYAHRFDDCSSSRTMREWFKKHRKQTITQLCKYLGQDRREESHDAERPDIDEFKVVTIEDKDNSALDYRMHSYWMDEELYEMDYETNEMTLVKTEYGEQMWYHGF